MNHMITKPLTALMQEDVTLSIADQQYLICVMQKICASLELVETSPTWMESLFSPYLHIYHTYCKEPVRDRFQQIIVAYYTLRQRCPMTISDAQIKEQLLAYFLATPHALDASAIHNLACTLKEDQNDEV